jgi:hypothetical protein
MNAQTQTQEVARADLSSMRALQLPADQAVDLFTERGFALAQRVAKALSSATAVPAQFQDMNLKKWRQGNEWKEEWVPNPAATGNCIVAMEVSRAVGMSVVAVMQNADMIEGKLRWSGKFVIAAINASGRFTPLRFQTKNLGRIKATYKEKGAYNQQKRGYDFIDHQVEIDNIECIAWALPKGYPEPRVEPATMQKYRGRMLDLYEDLGLPVVKSAPVTMEMAVQEGWYSKPGSKWQTPLKDLMFQYRAGSFFGNIHAPDIVMGMGPTTEEIRDTMVVDMGADGQVLDIRPEQTTGQRPPMADVVHPPAPAPVSPPAPSVPENAPRDAQKASPDAPKAGSDASQSAFDADAFAERMERAADAGDIDTMDAMADGLRGLADQDLADTLTSQYRRLRASAEEMRDGQVQVAPPAPAPAPAPAGRRTRASGNGFQGSLE